MELTVFVYSSGYGELSQKEWEFLWGRGIFTARQTGLK